MGGWLCGSSYRSGGVIFAFLTNFSCALRMQDKLMKTTAKEWRTCHDEAVNKDEAAVVCGEDMAPTGRDGRWRHRRAAKRSDPV